MSKVGEFQIVGYPRSLRDRTPWGMRGARLATRENKVFLNAVFERERREWGRRVAWVSTPT